MYPIEDTRGYRYLIKPNSWLDLINMPMSFHFYYPLVIDNSSHAYVTLFYMSFSFYRHHSCDTLPGHGTTETKAQTCSMAPLKGFSLD